MRRRTFLTAFLAAGGTALSATAIGRFVRAGDSRLKATGPDGTGRKPLSEETGRTLVAMAEALAGYSPLQGDYLGYYRWRAENVDGFAQLYENFAGLLRQSSRKTKQADFVDCSLLVRRDVVQALRPYRQKRNWWSRLSIAVSERSWLLFQAEAFLIQETLIKFCLTDAWLLLGYDSWPGSARGFDMQSPTWSPKAKGELR
jgi:hypothetical protein